MKKFANVAYEGPLFEVFKFRKNIDRASPVFWIFFFSLIAFIVGLSVSHLNFLAWLSGLILVIFVASFLMFLKGKF